MMKHDPTIQKIREIRHQISSRFNHDPKKIIEYYIDFQKQYKDRLLDESSMKYVEDNCV